MAIVWKKFQYNDPRIVSIASSAAPTPNVDTTDLYILTALAEAATFGVPTGTPTNGQKLLIRIKDDGTARSLSWNAIYVGGNLPDTTVASVVMYLACIYNSAASKWDTTPAGGISDTAYAASWDGVTTIAPSKNAVYDKIELREVAMIGAKDRPKFTWHDTGDFYIAGGWYDIRGTANKVVYIPTQVTFITGAGGSNAASSALGAGFNYIYIDYSAIPADNILVAASFLNVETAPTWDAAKGGLYGTAVGNLTANDRCIFATYGATITEFHHDGNIVMWADGVETQAALDIDDTFIDIGALRIPGFTTKGIVRFTLSHQLDCWWRTNGQTGAVGHKISKVVIGPNEGQHQVITDSSQIIELKQGAAGTQTVACTTEAWKFPVGM